MKRRRVNDYPELQVGFPERNDVSNPDYEDDGSEPGRDHPEGRKRTKLDRSSDMYGARVTPA